MSARRIRFLVTLALLVLAALSVRLYHLTVMRHAELREQAEKRRRRAKVREARRGKILCRDGVTALALDRPVDDVTLDLGRGDLEAVDLDHLLGPVGEVDPALGLHPADVAGPVPALARVVDEPLGRDLGAAEIPAGEALPIFIASRRAPRVGPGLRSSAPDNAFASPLPPASST